MGFIGTDRSGESATETWFPTAPTEPEPEHEDKTTTHDVTYSAEGIACCTGDGHE